MIIFTRIMMMTDEDISRIMIMMTMVTMEMLMIFISAIPTTVFTTYTEKWRLKGKS